MDDPAYVTIVILVFNAAVDSPTMLPMFPSHTRRHYGYLRDSHPQLVPHLPIEADSTVQHVTDSRHGKLQTIVKLFFHCKHNNGNK